jgi:hypothetical protein
MLKFHVKWIILVTVVLHVPSTALGQRLSSMNGLWVLAGVMPAGLPMEEVPKGINERHFYWFHDDGTVSLRIETVGGSSEHKGVWKQNGNRVVIVWENGVKNLVRVVTLAERSMILTGLDVRPLWFRFVRYF